MSYFYVAPNTTVCEDTPENRRRFAQRSGKTPSKRVLMAMDLNKRLKAQESSENARLRELARHLPGHEPDRF